uniref:BAG domain-containing protein n=1 Tax=Brugia timori TaxID=42155 RepID=A0A0R3QUM5_9BILA
LQELRQRKNNDAVKEDIRILRRVLQDLNFQRQNYKAIFH